MELLLYKVDYIDTSAIAVCVVKMLRSVGCVSISHNKRSAFILLVRVLFIAAAAGSVSGRM